MSDARFALQTAIYNALVAADVCGGRILAPVPENYGQYPFCEIGDMSDAMADAEGVDALETFVTLNVWSIMAGYSELAAEIDAIKAALHHQALTVSGRSFANISFRSSQMMRDPDGKTMHGVVTLRIFHQA